MYDALCRMLDDRAWKYEPHDDKLLIRSGIKGDDLSVEFIMLVNPRNEVVQFLSSLPFKMPEDCSFTL